MTLYEIDSKINELVERGFTTDCLNEDGEIDEEKVNAYLAELPVEREAKLDAYGCLIKNLAAEIEAIGAEEERLSQRRKAKVKKLNALEAAVVRSLESAGQTKTESPRVAFSLRRSEAVNIFDEEAVPDVYFTQKVTFQADKKAIKEDIKKGIEVPGAQIVTKANLQVK